MESKLALHDIHHIRDNSMKTTIDIPDEALRQVMKYTKAKTKREAVVYAIEDFNRRKRLSQLAKVLGTFENFMSQDELKEMRKDETWKKTKES